jgi:transcriptional regulator
MMLKQQFETENQSISFWIDDVSGALCIQSDRDVIEIPYNTAQELLKVLRQKQAEYIETNQKGWGWIWKG